jgi:hypothetical protein
MKRERSLRIRATATDRSAERRRMTVRVLVVEDDPTLRAVPVECRTF